MIEDLRRRSADAVVARASGENFPVASRLLPRRSRRHLLALYGFARLTDDIGDEAGARSPELLEWIECELDRVFEGEPEHPIMGRLAETVRACALEREPFDRLIAANRRDQTKHRYETFDELAGYCALSANPVGRLVLQVFGLATPERVSMSDRVCTALQLVEHTQDVREDYERGRIYIPREDLERFGVATEELGAPTASAGVRALVAFEIDRTRTILRSGAPLVRTLRGRVRFAVAGFVGGGEAALRAIERADGDVLRSTPKPSTRSIARLTAVGFLGMRA